MSLQRELGREVRLYHTPVHRGVHMGAVQYVYRRGATYWWRRRLVKKIGESDRGAVAISLRTREPSIARSIAARLTLESDHILSEGLPGMLSAEHVKALLAAAVRRHLRKLDRVAALERADGISAAKGRSRDLVMGWAMRLYSARGITAAIEPRDHAAILESGLSVDDFSQITATIASLRKQRASEIPGKRIRQMHKDCGATAGEADIIEAHGILQRPRRRLLLRS